MSVTIIEALQNAEINIGNIKFLGTAIIPLAQEQLHNAIVLLENGYGIDDEVEPLLDKYGDIENVPAKKSVEK